MTENDWLLEHFQKNRGHLVRVAIRMLGSRSEADDAVQEAWVRVARSGAGGVENLGGWLTTVVARVCLDVLRSRSSRREVYARDVPHELPAPPVIENQGEADALLADAIGPALLVVLETLAPAERVAFVLHDMFDLTFEEIAPVLGRSPVATRQLASRARRRVQLGPAAVAEEVGRHREIVSAFLRASRDGDFEALLAVLDPDVVLRADELAVQTAAAAKWAELPREARGARVVGETLRGRARGVRLALVDGAPGAAVAVDGKTRAVWAFVIEAAQIVEIALLMDPARLEQLEVVF
jgi:RNA polymerase sigma-70 factor (ECF subfamily)